MLQTGRDPGRERKRKGAGRKRKKAELMDIAIKVSTYKSIMLSDPLTKLFSRPWGFSATQTGFRGTFHINPRTPPDPPRSKEPPSCLQQKPPRLLDPPTRFLADFSTDPMEARKQLEKLLIWNASPYIHYPAEVKVK